MKSYQEDILLRAYNPGIPVCFFSGIESRDLFLNPVLPGLNPGICFSIPGSRDFIIRLIFFWITINIITNFDNN